MNAWTDFALTDQDLPPVPLQLVDPAGLEAARMALSPAQRAWVDAFDFQARPASLCCVPGASGELERVLVGVDETPGTFALAHLPGQLPAATYALATDAGIDPSAAAIGWGLAAYRFDRYRKADPVQARLKLPEAADGSRVLRELRGIALARDLINTPAADMMPADLIEATQALAEACGGELHSIVGDALVAAGYPCIHAVGRASRHLPALIDLRWGEVDAPRLTLVGKGICFDSGGLDLKPSAAMRLMKKDMGGAAHALGLASMIMEAGLPVRLRVLIAAAENAVSGDSFRPGDVLGTRKGLTVEIDNTDAEGRLVLCDALTEACSENPSLVVDFATLTGAARVAVGTEIGAMFCNRDDLAEQLVRLGAELDDPVWRLPLHTPYRALLDSRVADIVNSASGPFAGAITAALFLAEFVEPDQAWLHLDLMAWNTRARPGRPEGGEAMGLRTVMRYLEGRFPG